MILKMDEFNNILIWCEKLYLMQNDEIFEFVDNIIVELYVHMINVYSNKDVENKSLFNTYVHIPKEYILPFVDFKSRFYNVCEKNMILIIGQMHKLISTLPDIKRNCIENIPNIPNKLQPKTLDTIHEADLMTISDCIN
jgi:hypothetical protein